MICRARGVAALNCRRLLQRSGNQRRTPIGEAAARLGGNSDRPPAWPQRVAALATFEPSGKPGSRPHHRLRKTARQSETEAPSVERGGSVLFVSSSMTDDGSMGGACVHASNMYYGNEDNVQEGARGSNALKTISPGARRGKCGWGRRAARSGASARPVGLMRSLNAVWKHAEFLQDVSGAGSAAERARPEFLLNARPDGAPGIAMSRSAQSQYEEDQGKGPQLARGAARIGRGGREEEGGGGGGERPGWRSLCVPAGFSCQGCPTSV